MHRGKTVYWGAVLFLTASARVFAQNAAATINVDANGNPHPISSLVYGVAYGDSVTLPDLNCPVNRYGGNNTTRYNWQQNADNRGADWYFESIGDSSSVSGERGDTFISMSKQAGAQPMITIPIIDWVAKLGASRSKLAGFSISKYGAQTGNDWQWFPDAGNGVLKSGPDVTGNDPNDADAPNDHVFEQGWVAHIVNKWGSAAGGGLKYYILDNEHSIWFSTHRDVAPIGATMDEIRQKMIDYGAMIRSADASAKVVGPEEWGWSGYFYSGYDQQYGAAHNWTSFPDRAAHGNADYMPWLLSQLHQNELSTGTRVLDVFSLHYYPQGGEFGSDTSTSMQLLRNRSTRSLWDPNYVDSSWINDKVMLIPRMKSWVAANYPGLQTAITEYNWGAEGHMNGATTQADIFGIFGREGLDIATRWTTPDPSTPTYLAMKIYRNYDGSKSTFGDTSVSAGGPNPDSVSAFAAKRSSDGALTVMVVSKYLSSQTPVTVNLANFSSAGSAQVWQLASVNSVTAIRRQADISFGGASFSATVPSPSVTLFVIPSGTPNQPPAAVAKATPASGIAPLAVSFDGTGSSDSDGSISSYSWAFGDGSTGSGATASHTYAAIGTYTATLTVTDNRGATGTASLAITATSDPNVVNAPSNLTASVSKTRVVTLKWADNSPNETGFSIERAPAGTTAFAVVGSVAANVKTFSQTTASGRYLFRVRAVNTTTGRVSAYSNQVSVRVR
jgi:PKD repeat protein